MIKLPVGFYRSVFSVYAVILLIVMFAVSGDFGITWDEKVHKDYGENILKFFSSAGKDTSYIDAYSMIHLYGGFVETTAAAINKIFDGDVYEIRHHVLAVFGFLAMLFTGLLAKEMSGWRAGFFGIFFISLTPVFFGNSIYNSKDIPFATAYIMSCFFLIRFLKEIPVHKISTTILLSFCIAMAISIRVGGLLLMGYLCLFWLAKTILLFSSEIMNMEKRRKIMYSFSFLFAVLFVAYLASLIFWPYALTSPFKHPFESLKVMSDYTFNSNNLFEGKWIQRLEIPWYYIPKWIWITTPLYMSATIFIIPLMFIPKFNFFSEINKFQFSFIIFVAFFPIIYIIANNSNVYDGWRHLYFVYPPMVVIGALFWNRVIAYLSAINKYVKIAAFVLLFAFLAEPFLFMVRNHPLESFYFSPLIGGGKGAFRNYEIDYYGSSLRSAVEWIAAHEDSSSAKNKVRVRCYYGERESAEHFIKKYPHLLYVLAIEESMDWDYSIVMPVQAKHQPTLLENWPPEGAVKEFVADGAPVVAVVKNYRTQEDALQTMKKLMNETTSASVLINYGLKFFQAGDYLFCIASSEKALQYASANSIAYNNICASLNNLLLFQEASEYGKKAVELDPQFQLAKNNYQYALSMIGSKADKTIKERNYNNLSLVYYNMGQYEKCIECCRRSIELEPANAVAYNNICASMSALNKWRDAVNACEKALEIKNDFDLARNNLNYAKTQLR